MSLTKKTEQITIAPKVVRISTVGLLSAGIEKSSIESLSTGSSKRKNKIHLEAMFISKERNMFYANILRRIKANIKLTELSEQGTWCWNKSRILNRFLIKVKKVVDKQFEVGTRKLEKTVKSKDLDEIKPGRSYWSGEKKTRIFLFLTLKRGPTDIQFVQIREIVTKRRSFLFSTESATD